MSFFKGLIRKWWRVEKMADQKTLTDWEDGHGDNVNCDEEEQKMISQGMINAMW